MRQDREESDEILFIVCILFIITSGIGATIIAFIAFTHKVWLCGILGVITEIVGCVWGVMLLYDVRG